MAHALTIFLAAFLLFQVQFVVAKHLLPWFGGTPTVWSVCQVFFQTMLLAGYAYAHWLARRQDPRRQALIHGAVLLAASLWLVASSQWSGALLLPGEMFKPEGVENPVGQILLALLASVGAPFLVLAATSPLIQYWKAQDGGSLDRTYRLYALSNAGSLLGLLSYPFVVEVMFDLQVQAWLWSLLFMVFAVTCGRVAWQVFRSPVVAAPAAAQDGEPQDGKHSPRPSAGTIALWILLPLAASLMLVATTNRLCQDVAVVPFLWMLPLALYLATFIISFDRPQWYGRRLVVVAAVATLWVLYTAANSASIDVLLQLSAFGAFLFFFCLSCHGELARLRPDRAHLTLYFLAIATGGALGAAAVSLVAPVVFDDFWEFHVGIVLGWLVVGAAWWRDRASPFFRGDSLQFAVMVGVLVFLAAGVALRPFVLEPVQAWALAAAFAANLAMFIGRRAWRRAFSRHPVWSHLFLVTTTVIAAVALYRTWNDGRTDEILVGRNFYGVLRLRVYQETDDKMAVQLTHGRINHGTQYRTPEDRMVPTTYYSPRSGVGRAVAALRDVHGEGPLHLGVLGLGAGTLAAYAQPGDRVRFYEINPLVTMLSVSETPIFTFLAGSPGDVRVIPGDARLALETELADGEDQAFDLLAVDVFSSDAIPVHLLTVEAGAIYQEHLRGRDSILAIHTSNRFLDLEPVVAAIGSRLGLHGIIVSDLGAAPATFSSTWVLLSHDREILDRIAEVADTATTLGPHEVLFTDRYSNLFRILDR